MARTKQRPLPAPKCLTPLPPGTQPILRPGRDGVAYHIPISPPSTSSSGEFKTTIALPPQSSWSSGLHFHTQHTEYLHLVQGSIFLTLNGVTRIISAAAGGEVSVQTGELVKAGLVFEVPRYARHDWGRADSYIMWRYSGRGLARSVVKPVDVDEEVVVEEWTSPRDIQKALFFWNLNGVITAPTNQPLSMPQKLAKRLMGGWWVPFQLFVIFWELDNWPVFVSLRGVLWPSETGEFGFWSFEGPLEYLVTVIVLFAAKILGWLFGVRAVERARTPNELWVAYNE
ncbi:hypothetical protein FB567DRAFT_514824 [Paraphoma chrysanthemicola]|uniref:Uncharacterized protein n=1 Tax=Paraphoma chrysanthemicola TaxID=798071 RepID=A0A8K0RCT0_9PLEO|nr:hypothetical protein FB567DRAFT_514824 [Paraphoma chrysanthemicola]